MTRTNGSSLPASACQNHYILADLVVDQRPMELHLGQPRKRAQRDILDAGQSHWGKRNRVAVATQSALIHKTCTTGSSSFAGISLLPFASHQGESLSLPMATLACTSTRSLSTASHNSRLISSVVPFISTAAIPPGSRARTRPGIA
jgi:hypothetical protein